MKQSNNRVINGIYSIYTIGMLHNNYLLQYYSMKQLTLFETSHQVGEKPTVTFFPRIIREFDDHDEPMCYEDNSP
jgi:hypothetical protein